VRSEESEDNRYRFTFELAHPQASDLNDHNYVLYVMLNPTNDTTQQLDPWLGYSGMTFGSAKLPERILQEFQEQGGKIDKSSFRGTFDPTWQLQGFKVVYLYAQRLHARAHSVYLFGGLDISKINPNDSGEQQNTVSDKIKQCQSDRRCKAIVPAWNPTGPHGRVPPPIKYTYGNSKSERNATRILINQRMKEIITEINATEKGGHLQLALVYEPAPLPTSDL